jgi:phage terminase small subunit
MPLTDKQAAFVREYLIDLNATAAYQRAGYKVGPGRRAARANSSRMLSKAIIQEAIQAGMAERARDAGITAKRVLEEIALVAFSDIGDLVEFTTDGIRFREQAVISAAARRALCSVKVRREVGGEGVPDADVIEFKLWPKVPALQQLAQHLGLLKHVVEHTGRVRQIVIEEVVDRNSRSVYPPPPGDSGMDVV